MVPCRMSLFCHNKVARSTGDMHSVPTLPQHALLGPCRISLLYREVSACSVRTMQVMAPLSRSIGMQGIPVLARQAQTVPNIPALPKQRSTSTENTQ